jgi:hypothetical protein
MFRYKMTAPLLSVVEARQLPQEQITWIGPNAWTVARVGGINTVRRVMSPTPSPTASAQADSAAFTCDCGVPGPEESKDSAVDPLAEEPRATEVQALLTSVEEVSRWPETSAARTNLRAAATHLMLALRDLENTHNRDAMGSSCGCGALARVRSIVRTPRTTALAPFLMDAPRPAPTGTALTPVLPEWLMSLTPPATVKADRRKTGAITRPDSGSMEVIRRGALGDRIPWSVYDA